MTKYFHRILWLVGGLALLGGHRPAHAAPARPRHSAADKKEARRLFFKGLRSFGQRNYPDALARFNASYRLVPKNVVLYNIAMCHRALFAYTKAIRAFRKYQARKGRRLLPFKRRRIDRWIALMTRKLGRLELTIAPRGAAVRVDGREVGRAPLAGPLLVDPGRRTVEISHPGKQTSTLSINVVSGQLIRMGVTLQDVLRDGRLVLTCRASECRARVDGGAPQPLPVTLSLRAGVHRLRVEAPGYLPQRVEVRVVADEVVRRDVRLVAGAGGGPGGRRAWLKSWWFWTVVSVAVVAVGTTTGVLVWDQTRSRTPTDVTWRLR